MNMHARRQDSAEAPAGASATYQRQDDRQSNIVDLAISVQASSNTLSAVEYLKAHDIAAHIIERVLLGPQRRRLLGSH